MLITSSLSQFALLVTCSLALGGACTENAGEIGERRSYNYATELDGFLVYDPDQKRNDPRAGDPSYIYLEIGLEAVRLPGPILGSLAPEEIDELFQFHEPGVEYLPNGAGLLGLDVTINDRLKYRFEIEDFEDEGSVIGEARLVLVDDELRSDFVFAANGIAGVAHNLTIQAWVDGILTGSATAPVTIETRLGEQDLCEGPHNQDFIDEWLAPLATCEPGDVCVPVEAPGGCWQGAVRESAKESADGLVIEINCPEGCPVSPLPAEASCNDGQCQLMTP